jgi:hypothetical protein
MINEDGLIHLAKYDLNQEIRLAAIDGLTDQETLAYLARYDFNHEIKLAAIDGLTDQETLAYLARYDFNHEIKLAAISRLTDQETLAYLARYDFNHEIKLAAISRLTDKETLAYLAKYDSNHQIKLAAISRLTDKETLAYLAKYNSNQQIKLAAISRLTDQERMHQQNIYKVTNKISEYDAFLCHNSINKSFVKKISYLLHDNGIRTWLDEAQIPPGRSIQSEINKQILKIKHVVVFIGKDGIGMSQKKEIDYFLVESRKRTCTIIPVILPDADNESELSPSLNEFKWVDFRKKEPDPVKELVWGITGNRV